MKISFEANTSGFEQISKALEQQQKLLNENAAAAERLAKAQQGITKPQGAGRQDESLNYFKEQAKTIKDVTGVLQQLNQTQGGLHSFMSTFSKFRSELNASAAEQKGGIFSVLGLQVDNLKKSLAASALNIGEFKSQIKDLETSLASDPSNPNLRSQLGDARGFMNASQQEMTRNQYLYGQARMVQMMHQPIGTTVANAIHGDPAAALGGPGGPQGPQGPATGILGSMMGAGASPAAMMALMRYVSMAGAVGYGVKRAADYVGSADELAEQSYYRSNKSMYSDAMQGNMGQYYMQSRGMGRFGALDDKNIFDKMGDSAGFGDVGRAWGSGKGLGEGLSNVIGVTLNNIGSNLGMLTEEQAHKKNQTYLKEKATKASESEIDAFNATSNAALRSIMNPTMRRMDIEKGHGYARGIEDLLLRQGIGLDEAGSGLAMASRMGIDRGSLARGGAVLLRSGLETGIGNQANEEFFRRISMSDKDTQRGKLEQFLGQGQRSGLDLRGSLGQREQFTNIMAGIQGQFGGAVSEQEVGGRFMGALQSMQGMNMNPSDKMAVAANANSMMQNAIANPQTLLGAGMMKVLYGYNLDPMTADLLQKQIAAGRIDAAAKVIKETTNTSDSIDEIKAKIQGVGTQAAQARSNVLGLNTPQGQKTDEILKKYGMPTRGAYSATGDATRKIGMGTTPEMLSNIGGTMESPGNFVEMKSGNVSIGGTSQARLQETEAKTQESALIDAFSKEASSSGKQVGEILGEAFAKFTQNTLEEFRKAVGQDTQPMPAGPVTGAGSRKQNQEKWLKMNSGN